MKKLLSFAFVFIFALSFAFPVYASGWITPSEEGGQAEVGKVYIIEYETGVWHNTQQYCDITVTAPDGTRVLNETFKFSGIGDKIKTSFIPDQIGKYTIQEQCYYYFTNQIWNGTSMSSYTIKEVDNTKKNYLDVVKEIKKDKTSSSTKKAAKLTAKGKSFKVAAKTKKYTVILKDSKNKAIKKAKLTLKVNGKTYSAKTNTKGKATFKIKKLTKKGSYKAVVKFVGNGTYSGVSKTVKLTVKK